MPGLKEFTKEDRVVNEIENLCHNLFDEWSLDLNFQEKEIWLWNSLVEMAKIKQRRQYR